MTDKKGDFSFDCNKWMIGYEDDWVFHYVYGQDTEDSKAALMAMINVILGRGADPITELEILNPVNYRQFPMDKETTLDIKARTRIGDLIDIELQNGNLHSYQNRSLMYGGKLLNSSLEKGQKYDKMKKSIVISIVTGTLFPEISDLHTVFHLWEDGHRVLLSDRLELHYVELGKVRKDAPVETLSDVQRLAAYLKYRGDQDAEEYLNVLIDSGEEVIRLSEKRMERASEDFYARMRQIDIEMREHDIATARWIKEQEEAERKREEEERKQKEAEYKRKELEQQQRIEKMDAELQKMQETAQAAAEKAQAAAETAQADVEKAQADVEKAQADVEKAQADAETAKADAKRFSLLVGRLLDAGRIADLKRCTEDEAFKAQLYRELGI